MRMKNWPLLVQKTNLKKHNKNLNLVTSFRTFQHDHLLKKERNILPFSFTGPFLHLHCLWKVAGNLSKWYIIRAKWTRHMDLSLMHRWLLMPLWVACYQLMAARPTLAGICNMSSLLTVACHHFLPRRPPPLHIYECFRTTTRSSSDGERRSEWVWTERSLLQLY